MMLYIFFLIDMKVFVPPFMICAQEIYERDKSMRKIHDIFIRKGHPTNNQKGHPIEMLRTLLTIILRLTEVDIRPVFMQEMHASLPIFLSRPGPAYVKIVLRTES